MVRRVLSLVIGIPAAALIVLGGWTLAVADRPGSEAENYGGFALIVGLAAAAVAWAVYPRRRS